MTQKTIELSQELDKLIVEQMLILQNLNKITIKICAKKEELHQQLQQEINI